jgi:hypothetical protein
VDRSVVALLYGCAGRLTAQNGARPVRSPPLAGLAAAAGLKMGVRRRPAAHRAHSGRAWSVRQLDSSPSYTSPYIYTSMALVATLAMRFVNKLTVHYIFIMANELVDSTVCSWLGSQNHQTHPHASHQPLLSLPQSRTCRTHPRRW